jgi:hypothetical protein
LVEHDNRRRDRCRIRTLLPRRRQLGPAFWTHFIYRGCDNVIFVQWDFLVDKEREVLSPKR